MKYLILFILLFAVGCNNQPDALIKNVREICDSSWENGYLSSQAGIPHDEAKAKFDKIINK